jgi:hypothetical protein
MQRLAPMRRISNTADERAGLGIVEPSRELLRRDVRVWGSNVRPSAVWLSSENKGHQKRIKANAPIDSRRRNKIFTISDP